MILSTRISEKKPRAEFPLQRPGIVDLGHPGGKRDPARLALVAIALEEGVEDAGAGITEMPVTQGELRERLVRRRPFHHHLVQGRYETGTVRSGLAVDQRRFFERGEEKPGAASTVSRSGAPRERTTNSSSLQPEPVARLLFQLPGSVFAPPAQIDRRCARPDGQNRAS